MVADAPRMKGERLLKLFPSGLDHPPEVGGRRGGGGRGGGGVDSCIASIASVTATASATAFATASASRGHDTLYFDRSGALILKS